METGVDLFGRSIEVAQQQLEHSASHPVANPYPRSAYVFVQEALGFTVGKMHGNPRKVDPDKRHISGQQLCQGLREYAITKYGLLARSVLEHWNIHRTDDFGRIVYALIESGQLSCSDEDRIEDFACVYSFDEAFDQQRILDSLMRN